MKNFVIIGFLMFFYISGVIAAPMEIKTLRVQTSPDNVRLVFDVSKKAKYNIFQLINPNRLVVDFDNALVKNTLSLFDKYNFIKDLRYAKRGKNNFRVVLELKNKLNTSSFLLVPNKTKGHRLVIDLLLNEKKSTEKKAKKAISSRKTVKKTDIRKVQPFIVAIDAGHGGKDPGAHGKNGTLEKKVVFAIAKKLAVLINKQKGMKAVLVRKGDYYIKLRRRMEIAREANADLFISIHADAFKNKNVSGASVFTLSRRGATSEAARWLAKHENAADFVGGVSLDDKDDVLASVLLDLSQTASQDISQLVAKEVLANFGHIGKLHSHTVQKAGFMVLKSPDIPSILVETAFISNPKEERRLLSSKYQYKMAKAIHKGVVTYAKKHTLALNRANTEKGSKHTISKGETLSGIAHYYGVSLKKLKRVNMILSSNRIQIGQVLSIPLKG